MRARQLAAAIVLFGAGVLAPGAARAASCSMLSVTAPMFANYDPMSNSTNDTVGTIAYSCTGGAMVTITLSAGNGTFGSRYLLRGGAFRLPYNLYLDALHTMIWGDGVTPPSNMSPVMSPADNAVVSVPIYASIPTHQDVAVGTYSDSIMVTLNF